MPLAVGATDDAGITVVDDTAGEVVTPARPYDRRRGPGVRGRLFGWYVVLLLLAIVGSVLFERTILLRRLESRADVTLTDRANELRRLTRPGGDAEPGDVVDTFDIYLDRHIAGAEEAFVTLVDGRVHRTAGDAGALLATPGLVQRWAELDQSERGETTTPAGPVRWLAVPVGSDDGDASGTFVAVALLAQARADVNHAVRMAALFAVSVIVVVSALAWVVAGRVLGPLRRVSDTARAITDTDLSQRIEVDQDDEIGELAETFNSMLDRLEAAFAREREFLNDASHELRTPITVVRGHLELLGDDPDPEERRETMALVTDELDRMGRLVGELLLLAKAERPGFLQLGPVDIDALVSDVHAKAQALAPRRWRLEKGSPVTLQGDRQRLTQVLMNLAANAVDHTEPDDEIAIGAAADTTTVRLWVRDTGTGVALEEQERIFRRFARGGARRRTEGAGLGLAIVRAIAEAHGGFIELASRPGHGATFTLVLPLEARP